MNETDKFIMERFDMLDDKIDLLSDKIDKRISPLEIFQYKLIGIVILISFVIPILISCVALAQ
jgi:hypothetical protein